MDKQIAPQGAYQGLLGDIMVLLEQARDVAPRSVNTVAYGSSFKTPAISRLAPEAQADEKTLAQAHDRIIRKPTLLHEIIVLV
ncbi:MAG: hypothetical protein LBI84_07615 [Propionibacteriaceae bacterium]|jgi:hypothetical protein|nr:hypothetical protein [Propionibacteriaceae bacterium]